MATSTGKSVGLILLVIFIISFFAISGGAGILGPLGFLMGPFRLLKTPVTTCLDAGPSHFFRLTSFSFLSLVLLILWIAVIIWVYRDAERRGMNGVLWALLVFIGNLIALLIYLIVRSDSVPPDAVAAQPCPECQKPVASNHVFCPYCGTRLQAVCPGCEKPIEREWQVCPHCGKKLTEKGKT